MMEEKIDLKNVLTGLPPLLTRKDIKKYFRGIISDHSVQAFDSRGTGPKKYKLNGKAVYRTVDFLDWLEAR